jgi:hypothetical protein
MTLAHIAGADKANADRSHEALPERNILWTKQFGTFILFMAAGVKSGAGRQGNHAQKQGANNAGSFVMGGLVLRLSRTKIPSPLVGD